MTPQTTLFQRVFIVTLSVLTMTTLYLLSSRAAAQEIAITFDDGFDPRIEPRAARWNSHMLDTLAKHNIRSMIFPAGIFVDSSEGLALIRSWGEAGHAIGDHTYTHQGFIEGQTAEEFMQDVLHGKAVVSSMPGWCPRLRLPYLNEGKTPEQRNQLYSALSHQGYGVAPVTISIDDWNDNQRFLAAANQNPGLDLTPYRKPYLDKLWQEIQKQQAHWQQQLGRNPPQVLLLHTNGLNAIMLPDILAMLKARGWTFVDPAAAFSDPIYQRSFTTADGLQHPLPIPTCR
ncbi:polysaccharide deacetylase family protein [Bordetella trematum]|uniref:polysaccharide deacetylase family protein n=1 Tax=Bordetella trematum TaxID=123899 RepID=UPI003AF381C9